MKQTPIIFRADMILALLAGRKTQTRRVVKPQHISVWAGGVTPRKCFYGGVGDVLWVREVWAVVDNTELSGKRYYEYKADKPDARYPGDWPSDTPPTDVPIRWRSPIYMPRLASRITLTIEAVRMERVQDISESDALAEGSACREHFILFEKLNGRNSFAENPWVWVIQFSVAGAKP